MLEIESSDITDLLVGITPLYLNTFFRRKLYGITASVQEGEVRAKRRLFSEADVYGIALVWMLFESGLRTQVIRRILNELGGTKKANARATAEVLHKSGAEYIVVLREPRKPRSKTEPEPKIRTAKNSELAEIVTRIGTANTLIVPISAKFKDIEKRLAAIFGG
jgi:hypothetical protein